MGSITFFLLMNIYYAQIFAKFIKYIQNTKIEIHDIPIITKKIVHVLQYA